MTLAELKAKIEAEALRRQAAREGFTLDALSSFLGDAAPLPAELRGDSAPPPDPLTFGWFAGLHGREFMDAAYRMLLGRDPDAQGLRHYLELLARGEDKAFILGALAYSGEGRTRGVRVVGLAPRFAVALVRRVPLAGALLGWLVALATAGVREREARAFEERTSQRVDALAKFVVKSNVQVAGRVEALHSVMQSRD
jgi:O-antigen chain-terminating methyltransferase